MSDQSVERGQGVVKFFDNKKGYGFCAVDAKPDVFIHVNELKRSGQPPMLEKGDVLEFDMVPVPGKGPKGSNIRRVVG